jgi:hypothetical protein
MAPRVDRPVVRASPPGGARFADSQGSMERPISDLERNTEIVRTSEPVVPVTLQGSRCMRRATETSSGRFATASAGV